jgi:hypothetical protein
MTSLAVAVEKREWRLVSLYLLLGVTEAASRLPPETLSDLIDLLGGEPETKAPRRETRRG